jgi:MarR family 2-MHQ and catechol resistance regulon transcriptional repressor
MAEHPADHEMARESDAAGRGRAGPGEPPADPVTMVGLVLESAAGLRRSIEPSVACTVGAGAPWFEVLIRLARSPGHRLRMSDLAAQTNLTPSGLTRAVDRLTEHQLVVREACPGDRRGAYAALTERGRSEMAAFLPRHEEFLCRLLGGVFTADEEQLFVDLLRKLRDRVHPGAGRSTEPGPDEAPGT